jgi:hypothetical protein
MTGQGGLLGWGGVMFPYYTPTGSLSLLPLSTRVFTKTHGARHNPLSCFPSLPFRPLTFYLIFLLLLFSLVSCLE